MKLNYLKHAKVVTFLAIFIVNILFFSLTNPNKVNSVYLILGFVLLTILIYSLLDIFLLLIGKSGLRLKNTNRIAGFIAVLIGLLIALQSIGQLTLIDVIVVLPLWLIGYVYLTYIKVRN